MDNSLQTHPPGLAGILDSDIAWQALQRFIDTRQAASVIRLGDGEGVVLARPSLADPWSGPYLATHFGPAVRQHDLERLAERLELAARRATILGVRTDVCATPVPQSVLARGPDAARAFLLEHVPLRNAEVEVLRQSGAYRLAQLSQVMQRLTGSAGQMLVSAWCHFDWLESGHLADLLVNEQHIGLITGRGRLADGMRAFGLEVDYRPVPLRFFRGGQPAKPWFPGHYEELLATLDVSFPGQVVLVGAGICGKVYCDVIARRGGIAIDIGAVCDAWLGISSRRIVARERWLQESVPDALLLKSQLAQRTGRSGKASP